MIPSTFLFTGPDTGAAAPSQMNDLMIYALAAGMGVVLGTILGLPQWLALRHHVPKAGWWVLGMVVVFLGTSFLPAEGITLAVALVLLLFVVAAGALVGAVHGLVLIWLLHHSPLHATA
jgi:NhaP-type Na+/H+ or K+/H+ antiporter